MPQINYFCWYMTLLSVMPLFRRALSLDSLQRLSRPEATGSMDPIEGTWIYDIRKKRPLSSRLHECQFPSQLRFLTVPFVFCSLCIGQCLYLVITLKTVPESKSYTRHWQVIRQKINPATFLFSSFALWVMKSHKVTYLHYVRVVYFYSLIHTFHIGMASPHKSAEKCANHERMSSSWGARPYRPFYMSIRCIIPKRLSRSLAQLPIPPLNLRWCTVHLFVHLFVISR